MGNIWPPGLLPVQFIQLLVLLLPPKGDGGTLLLRDSLKMTTKTVSSTPLALPLSLPLSPMPLMFPIIFPMSTTQLPLLSQQPLSQQPNLFSPMLPPMSTLATPLPTTPWPTLTPQLQPNFLATYLFMEDSFPDTPFWHPLLSPPLLKRLLPSPMSKTVLFDQGFLTASYCSISPRNNFDVHQ